MSSVAEIADPVLEIVERTWGFTSLLPLQRQAIDAVLAGQDSLLVTELRLREPLVLVGDLDRPNLRYRVVPRTDEVLQVEDVIRRHPP